MRCSKRELTIARELLLRGFKPRPIATYLGVSLSKLYSIYRVFDEEWEFEEVRPVWKGARATLFRFFIATGMTQPRLSMQLGVSQPSISRTLKCEPLGTPRCSIRIDRAIRSYLSKELIPPRTYILYPIKEQVAVLRAPGKTFYVHTDALFPECYKVGSKPWDVINDETISDIEV